jgi:heme/copper-type cytochrome/quinol oxidase subunit 4
MIALLLSGTIALVYGALIAFAALKQMRKQELSLGAAAVMGVIGLIIMGAAIFIPFHVTGALYVLIAGLLLMHIMAIRNGQQLNGKINPKHHIVRFIVSLLITLLAVWGLYATPTL